MVVAVRDVLDEVFIASASAGTLPASMAPVGAAEASTDDVLTMGSQVPYTSIGASLGFAFPVCLFASRSSSALEVGSSVGGTKPFPDPQMGS